jgi:hypothetical protein
VFFGSSIYYAYVAHRTNKSNEPPRASPVMHSFRPMYVPGANAKCDVLIGAAVIGAKADAP